MLPNRRSVHYWTAVHFVPATRPFPISSITAAATCRRPKTSLCERSRTSSGNVGIRFQGAFVDSANGGPSDGLIDYKVTAPEGKLIKDVHLAANPLVIGGDGVVSVTETFLPDNDQVVLSAYDIQPGSRKLQDWADLVDANGELAPVQTLHVQKDIIAWAQSTGSVATMSFLDQTFSQCDADPMDPTSCFEMGSIATFDLNGDRTIDDADIDMLTSAIALVPSIPTMTSTEMALSTSTTCDFWSKTFSTPGLATPIWTSLSTATISSCGTVPSSPAVRAGEAEISTETALQTVRISCSGMNTASKERPSRNQDRWACSPCCCQPSPCVAKWPELQTSKWSPLMTNTAADCLTKLYIAMVGPASPELRDLAAPVAIHLSLVFLFHRHPGRWS